MQLVLSVISFVMIGWLTGCATVTQDLHDKNFQPVEPVAVPQRELSNGSIYHAGTSRYLFEDIKARRVGDTLTIILDEATNASKSASTSASKSTNLSAETPVILGRDVTSGGTPIFELDVGTTGNFDGEGDSSQSNQLTGNVSVTVSEVLSNGNLVVKGEKHLTLNQGSEVVRIKGIVRPVDITAQNTVLSTQIAAAEITYGGNGVVANASRPGLLTRFFMRFWPL